MLWLSHLSPAVMEMGHDCGSGMLPFHGVLM